MGVKCVPGLEVHQALDFITLFTRRSTRWAPMAMRAWVGKPAQSAEYFFSVLASLPSLPQRGSGGQGDEGKKASGYG